jgi:hypothetical protein
MIVVQGKYIMADWFPPELHPDTLILTSDTGFTNNQIALEFLKHYIKHSDAGPQADWKLLLMDNHGSHETPEFINLANDNYILPYPLLPHMTHCMQPLDVGVFQPYKHWHDEAIKDALAGLDVEYGLRSFLRDLEKIRRNTFKKDTIRHAFKKSGMYPPNVEQCLKQLKVFSPPQQEEPSLPTLPPIPKTPTKPMECDSQLDKWGPKFTANCSSPSRPQWESFVKGTKLVLAKSQLQECELQIHQDRRREDLERKTTKRKVIQKFGGLTKRDAQAKIDAIKRKEDEAEAKRQKKFIEKQRRQEKAEKYREGVEARKLERARVKKVKELTNAKQDIPPNLLIPIPDPEKAWLANQKKLKEEEEEYRKQKEEQEEEATFVLDSTGDQDIQHEVLQDFIPFPSFSNEDDDDDDSDDDDSKDSSISGSEDSELYNSDNDYSWHGRHREI